MDSSNDKSRSCYSALYDLILRLFLTVNKINVRLSFKTCKGVFRFLKNMSPIKI